jgi:hypothetical protein
VERVELMPRTPIKLHAGAGYRAWIVAENGPVAEVEVEVDGIEEPYMTDEARRMHERALHPRVVHARLGDGTPVEIVAEQVTAEQRAHHQKLLDEAPETRPRLFHRVIVDLPEKRRERLDRIRAELDWFVATRRESEDA